ncbi:hypothetical protein B5F44_11790 [Gordonibacter urolithinfaciens]|nr:hypothetical protein B5F44_11790 [Gordonibacter urolithinfaciens]ROT93190.1 hypothetical protein DMP13_02855 [Gordonibacter urolithinfaciens]
MKSMKRSSAGLRFPMWYRAERGNEVASPVSSITRHDEGSPASMRFTKLTPAMSTSLPMVDESVRRSVRRMEYLRRVFGANPLSRQARSINRHASLTCAPSILTSVSWRRSSMSMDARPAKGWPASTMAAQGQRPTITAPTVSSSSSLGSK